MYNTWFCQGQICPYTGERVGVYKANHTDSEMLFRRIYTAVDNTIDVHHYYMQTGQSLAKAIVLSQATLSS